MLSHMTLIKSIDTEFLFFIFFPVGEQIEMQVLEHNEILEVEAPELPAPQPGQLINIGVLILTIKPKLTLQSNSLGRYV